MLLGVCACLLGSELSTAGLFGGSEGEEMQNLALIQAQAWVDVALQAWVRGLPDEIRKALQQAERLQMNHDILHLTGTGLILNADLVWHLLGARWKERRVRLLASWKKEVQKGGAVTSGKKGRPFQGLRPACFKEKLDALLQFVGDPTGLPYTSQELQAAMVFASKGFLRAAHLEGLCSDQVDAWSDDPRVKSY